MSKPTETKIQNRRWKCPHCSIEGWSTGREKTNPLFDHDMPDGRRCRRAERAHEAGKQAPTQEQIREHVLSTFSYHCGAIMTEKFLNGFGLYLPGGDGVYVTMKVVSHESEGVSGWDQCEVNGVRMGNRHGAREEYARLCAPIIAAACGVK